MLMLGRFHRTAAHKSNKRTPSLAPRRLGAFLLTGRDAVATNNKLVGGSYDENFFAL